ncbi:putative beta-galactosidase protein [Neofusicoccum parvum UCRNP2]|uniref:beta-galactosidase n=1 Tax=Botryosphaeria parva (strain UCR-NP2) TaxID=1287680 RepID=R1ERM3_BOTPV|nr:putative beta-galactosidase protein [Neofusicoccum parvum UCRNP2]
MEYVEQQARRNGILVPLISNDMTPLGNWAPGTGQGEADIYAHDSYPFYNGCANPTNWSDPTPLIALDYTYQNHLQQSPSTPYSVLEFQGGAPDPWGGVGLDKCAALIGPEFQRVFQKELIGRSIKILNIYMTYGGTNWGNMGHPEGYTSYDHGAMIAEDRSITREKYSEAKLQAHFLQASPAYLTAIPENKTHAYVDTEQILVTPIGNHPTRFYLVRHTDWTSWNPTPYRLTVPTSAGNLTVPQLGGTLTLNGRDSKIHVTDYDVGGTNLIYSSAEIFTWKKYAGRTVLLLYGGEVRLPDLHSLDWKYVDSLPEIFTTYDDSNWIECVLLKSNNPRNLTTPTSLYAGDYGFHAGSLIYRGHFVPSESEKQFNLTTQGGDAFGHSLWINQTFLQSFAGDASSANHTQSFNLSGLQVGQPYVLTLVMDHMGLNMNSFIHSETMKEPRGILDYSLSGQPQSDITWTMTGNLGGEDYVDIVRGPLNEGAISPFEGIAAAGIGFYSATFDLDLPASGYDIPLSLVFTEVKTTEGTLANFRCQIYVNGYQYGKYINNLGPQTSFPVPEGILNYNGRNTLAITLWNLDDADVGLVDLQLVSTQVIQSGYKKPSQAPQPVWTEREGAF